MENQQEEVDITKLKYVLYLRKSTDDPGRQVRSIEDQEAECLLLAQRMGIFVVKPYIKEKKSAKKPGQRPFFTQMLKDLRSGKFDGILAWNPDRLARNMKEGGEIIDMIDENQIKDLKFVTHHFTKDANGKMLLGMAFVLSKQYSDKLSQDVTRGVRRKFQEGKSPIPKHGYIRDENKLYKPDGKNFELIVNAWKMRKDGESLEAIAKFLNDSGYIRVVQSSGKKVLMSKQILSNMFKDPFYYGLLIQANQKVDLREIYGFQPAITEEDYIEVQRLSGTIIKPYNKKRATYYPLKMMITCSFCGNHMYAGASKSSSGNRYLFYRCDGKYCNRKKRSIRAKIIFDFIYDLLDQGLAFTSEDYQDYLEAMTNYSSTNREKILMEIHSSESRIKSLNRETRDISYKILEFDKDSIVRKTNEDRLQNYQDEIETLRNNVAKLKSQLVDPEQEIISFQQFLNLSKNASRAVQMGDAVVKDAICRLIFLNFTVDEEKVLSWQAKQPFDELLKTRSVVSSRGERT